VTDINSDSANRRIISRMQQRRGLKQDIPQPLRPGEIGFAIDSRQLYVGGDPNDPNAAQFSAVSFFENTTGAVDLTNSITENQIIAFTVPFIKFNRSVLERREFQWKADFVRSTSESAPCFHSGSTKPVFRPGDAAIESTITDSNIGRAIFIDLETTGNLIPRVGDLVQGTLETTGDTPTLPVVIESVSVESARIVLNVNRQQITTAGNPVTVIPASLIDFRTNSRFVSKDVVVSRNGIRLTGEPDSNILARPSPIADYALDATNIFGDQEHELSLRTRTTSRDEISICYYSQTAVRQAFNGIPRPNDPQGRSFISGSSNIESFYSAYDIPEYRRIDDENIRLSTTSGLGFIGLQQKHIAVVAEGDEIPAPNSLSLGNLLISRDDEIFNTTTVAASESDSQRWVITFSDLTAENNPFSTTATTLIRSFNRVRLFVPSDENNPLNGVLAGVESVSEGTQQITVLLPSDVDGAAVKAANPTGFSEIVKVNPVLAFNLSNITTLREAVTEINKSNVEFKLNRTVRNLFPLVEYTPVAATEEPLKNQIFLTQNPSFSSVAAGGINFRLYEDSANTLAALGLTPGHYTRNVSVRSKLEQWLHGLLQARTCNLFTSILPANQNLYTTNTDVSFSDTYNIQVDATFGDITFCTREEAANFNFLVNKAYTDALFDRAQDIDGGVRGLVNLKNNVEIQTREGAVIGERISTFIDMERALIPSNPGADFVVFTLPADVYNSYQIEYSINEQAEDPDTKYARIGQLMVIGRPDFTDLSNASASNDQFSSHFEDLAATPDPERELIEPQFFSRMTENDEIEIVLKTQTANLSSGVITARHTIGEELIMRYIIKRWSSIQ